MQLQPHVLYEAEVSQIAFGSIPADLLLQTLSSGRLCVPLLEAEIAAVFGIEQGPQGAGPDLIDRLYGNGDIQVKSYQSTGLEVYKGGPHRGKLKASVPKIWTTKSGFWDRKNRLTEEELAEARSYPLQFDNFLYLDISRMLTLSYSFVVVPSETVVEALVDNFYIAEADILAQVHDRVDLRETAPLSPVSQLQGTPV